MHTTTITRPDRAALENLWGDAGIWAADTWTEHNRAHFGGQLRYEGVVFGLTPYGDHLAHTYHHSGRITLHPSLLDPSGEDPWGIEENERGKLGVRFAQDTLLHEMIHAKLSQDGVEYDDEGPHNAVEWCAEIVRITPGLGLDPIKAAPVKPRRVGGKVVRRALDGHLSRRDIASWPHSIRSADFYIHERIRVPI